VSVRTQALITLACLCVFATAHAGTLVSRSDKGLQFTEAFLVTVNGKDKVLNLGAQPKLTGPIGKLASVHLPGTLLKDGVANVIGVYSEGEIEYILPEGLPKNAPTDPAGIWRTAKLSYKKAANDKMPTDVPIAEFVAFLEGGAEELTRLCQDEHALEIIGGKGKTFPTQLEWLSAVVKANASNPAMAPLEKYVARAMRQRYEQFENGTGGVDVLEQGLKFAELSQDIYPSQPEQQQLRKALTDRKIWLDRKIAVLRAFLAAQEWDAFLLGDRDFEKYQQAFPEMAAKYSDALKQSLQLHRQTGDDRLKESEFGSAYREFRIASMRQPSDKVMQQRVSIAWADYSRRVAIDRQGVRKQLSAGQREAIGQALRFATGYKEQNKLDLALNSVLEAAAIDPESLPVLLKKAEILGAQHQFTKALESLDDYDQLAIDEERKPASDLRNDLLFKRTSTVEDIKAQFAKAWAESRFSKIRDLALEGLRAKDDDAELLDNGGRASLITRNVNDGRGLLTRYLEISNTLDANSEQRVRVRRLLATLGNTAPAESGEPNWMSGKKLPKGVFYCPLSLAFQPKVERIDAGKLKVTYDWAGERLRAIVPTFEKNERLTTERKISFAYDEKVPQIASVAYEDAAKAPSGTDADEIFRQSSLVLLNNPYVDPVAVEKLTQKNVAIGIAGNRFFQPFVWDKIHYFQLTYDSSGRVAQAREVEDPKAAPGDMLLEFEWDGLQLAAVRGYQGDAKRRVMIYERTMQYQDARLVSEEIESQGKSSHIKYTYNGNRLVSAESGADPTLDNRGRKVFFLPSSPSTLVN
jgi:hypothetical protein